MLKNFDVVGLARYYGQKNKPRKHFRGNCWWANSNYIKTLPKIPNYKDRMFAETWVCKNTKIKMGNVTDVFYDNKDFEKWLSEQ